MNRINQVLASLSWPGQDAEGQNVQLAALLISKPTNIRYLSGFTGSNGVLLLTKKANYLVTDFRYLDQAAEEAPHFTTIRQGESLAAAIYELAQEHRLQRIGVEKEVVTLAFYEELKRHLSDLELVAIADPCAQIRRVKTPAEIDKLRKAIEIADRAFLHMRDFLQPGQTEQEVALELEFFMRRLGAEKTSFTTIVASGWRSALPHGTASGKTLAPGELVVMDYGAVYGGYCSDLTRTLILGQPDTRQQEVYQLVLQAQEKALNNIGPGMTAREADALARRVIAEGGHEKDFGHGLGHGVGLDIHEGPRLSPRDETVLEPGMVVTVEPGVYISGWGGVRIEDIVLITSGGCEVLTRSPKRLADMVILR